MRSLLSATRSTKVGLTVAAVLASLFTAGSSGAVSLPAAPSQAPAGSTSTAQDGTPGAVASFGASPQAVPSMTDLAAAGAAFAQEGHPALTHPGAPATPKPAPKKPGPKRPAPKKPAPKKLHAREPATPLGLPAGIEPLPDYVAQVACQPGFRPGTAALAHLLQVTYPGTHSGGVYACGSDGIISEHYDGRAIDWMNSVRNPVQAAQAEAVLHWLLDPDKAGHSFAIARRIGLMYVIWNNSIWSASDQRWDPYENCAQDLSPSRDSFCHRNHIHISLSWDGAFGRTSFFSRQVVTSYDFGPCRAKDLNWAGFYTGTNYNGCATYPKLSAPAGSTPVMQGLISWSGDLIGPGSTGPAVTAVQNALAVPATGHFDAATAAAVIAFKRAHKLVLNPVIGDDTWRALLTATPPVPVPPKTPAPTTAPTTAGTKTGAPKRSAPHKTAPRSAPGKTGPGAPTTPQAPTSPNPLLSSQPGLGPVKPVLVGPSRGSLSSVGISAH